MRYFSNFQYPLRSEPMRSIKPFSLSIFNLSDTVFRLRDRFSARKVVVYAGSTARRFRIFSDVSSSISVTLSVTFSVTLLLAKEIGGAKAAKELGIPEGTIHTWLKAVRAGKLDVGEGSHTPASAMSLSEEITMLRKRVKEQDKEIRRLKEENEFLEEASAFFAASRRKSAKTRE